MPQMVVQLVLVMAFVPYLLAQSPVAPRPDKPPTNPRFRDAEYPVTVEGCLRGKSLEVDRTRHKEDLELVGNAREFTLEGSKEFLEQFVHDHDGHRVEISGIAIVVGSQEIDGQGTTIEVGDRTRIFARGRDSGSDRTSAPSGSRVVRLKVNSVSHIGDKCAVH